MKINTVEELKQFQKNVVAQRDPNKITIIIGNGTCCSAVGSNKIVDTFKKVVKDKKLDEKVVIRVTGCLGFSEQDPVVVVRPQNIFFSHVTPEAVEKIVVNAVEKNNLYSFQSVINESEIPYFKKQNRLLTNNFSEIDPLNIEDYIGIDGYAGLAKALSMSPEQIIDEIKKSGLRGRGGAGFSTGKKWELCRQASSEFIVHGLETKGLRTTNDELRTKYVICNADEGDPGAFMDRSLLEGNPHSVIEGLIIAAYAIGAKEGYIFVRNEYPLAVQHLELAIEQAKEYGFLGDNILGSGFSFNITVNRGAGAFVAGEETGLMSAIEGNISEPRPRPPYPAQRGLWNQPTNINNTKTLASVPLIIRNGAEWYNKIGTEKSKGTMIFSLVGKVNNTGLVEVPMGIKLHELVYDIGGGIIGGKKFKAIQTGGPSGGCIPEKLLDLPIDYEALAQAGSIMGSGGMIVMDEDTCMVNIAKYFINFTAEESCGKCTPCREGTKHMLEILTRITEGKGQVNDIELLQKTGEMIRLTSLCALGGTAPNPVLTTIRYFRDEYEAHIRDKKCPAKECKSLITYKILADKCTGCTACIRACPENCISGENKKVHVIDQNKCTKCGACLEKCKFDAIEVT